MKCVITITKPTAMPGEVTTVTQEMTCADDLTGHLRQAIGKTTRAIDWRVRSINDEILARTDKFLRAYKHGR